MPTPPLTRHALHNLMLKMSEGAIVASKTMPPEEFRAFFGGFICNVLGHLPDDYWKEFEKVQACDNPGCDCHLLQEKVMPAFKLMREDHQRTMAKSPHNN